MYKIFLLAGFFFILGGWCVEKACAATWYMPDDCLNLQDCFEMMESGDSLIIRDGTYTGGANTITSTQKPPDGSGIGSGDERFTHVMAQHDGQVVFDCESARQPVLATMTWVKLRGMVFGNSSGAGVVINEGSSHVYLYRIGVYDMGDALDAAIDYTRSTYGLIEECYVWGNIRYGIMVHGSSHTIVRRCVVRSDRSNVSFAPRGAFRNYGGNGAPPSEYNEWQNNIAIDGDTRTSLTNDACWLGLDTSPYYGIFYSDADSPNVHWYGNMAINNHFNSHWLGDAPGNVIEESVYWNNWNGIELQTPNNQAVINHVTIGNSYQSGTDGSGVGQGMGIGYYQPTREIISNSIIYDNINFGLRGDGSGDTVSNYNNIYGNGINYSGVIQGGEDILDVDPYDGNPGNGIAALNFPFEIQSGSDLKSAASDGHDIGATIRKQYGAAGSFYDEPGYASLTENDLWPFPYEAQIKSDMSQYTYNEGGCNINGARGFTATGTGLYGGQITLTSYLWESFGGPCPTDVCDYDSDPDTTPPAVPAQLQVQ